MKKRQPASERPGGDSLTTRTKSIGTPAKTKTVSQHDIAEYLRRHQATEKARLGKLSADVLPWLRRNALGHRKFLEARGWVYLGRHNGDPFVRCVWRKLNTAPDCAIMRYIWSDELAKIGALEQSSIAMYEFSDRTVQHVARKEWDHAIRCAWLAGFESGKSNVRATNRELNSEKGKKVKRNRHPDRNEAIERMESLRSRLGPVMFDRLSPRDIEKKDPWFGEPREDPRFSAAQFRSILRDFKKT